jgi:hypothetical protein
VEKNVEIDKITKQYRKINKVIENFDEKLNSKNGEIRELTIQMRISSTKTVLCH